MELDRILVIIDAEVDSQPVLQRAGYLASCSGASVELFAADFNTYLEDGYYFDPEQARKLRYAHGEERLAELEGLAEGLRARGIEVAVATAWGNPPYGEILRRIEEIRPSLVIQGTRHHHKIARLLLSNADWEMVKYCPVPLLLVKDSPWAEKPAIIAAVDPDHVHEKPAELDDLIVSAACNLAEATGGAVKLYHSDWLPPLSGTFPLQADPGEENMKLVKLARSHSLEDSACHLSSDKIDESLPALVTQLNASVVVMGAISRSRLDRLLIGNTAERLLDLLSCDVLVMKPATMPATSQILI